MLEKKIKYVNLFHGKLGWLEAKIILSMLTLTDYFAE